MREETNDAFSRASESQQWVGIRWSNRGHVAHAVSAKFHSPFKTAINDDFPNFDFQLELAVATSCASFYVQKLGRHASQASLHWRLDNWRLVNPVDATDQRDGPTWSSNTDRPSNASVELL